MTAKIPVKHKLIVLNELRVQLGMSELKKWSKSSDAIDAAIQELKAMVKLDNDVTNHEESAGTYNISIDPKDIKRGRATKAIAVNEPNEAMGAIPAVEKPKPKKNKSKKTDKPKKEPRKTKKQQAAEEAEKVAETLKNVGKKLDFKLASEKHASCESWFREAVDLYARPIFSACGLDIPEKLFIALGFPRGNKAVGQCWHPKVHHDGETTSIFVSPVHSTAYDALDTLYHELVHACIFEAGHGKDFVEACNKVGLTNGKATCRAAGPELLKLLEAQAEALGPFPHMPIADRKFVARGDGSGEGGGGEGEDGEGGGKKRKAWPKFVSPENPDYCIQMGPKALEASGGKPPICPLCGESMVEKE